jgi:ABC-type branched-subunit amino acid transport system substrate-binding protein
MMRYRHGRLVAAMSAAAALVALSACGSSAGPSTGSGSTGATATANGAAKVNPSLPPVVIGVVGELSGPIAGGYVSEPLTGAQAAADYINAELGGFGGRKVQVVTCDSQSTAAGALTCANQFVAAKAQFVVGLSVYWASDGIAAVSKAGIVNQTVPVGPQEVTGPNAFPLSGGVYSEYPAQSSYAVKHLGSARGALALGDAGAINALGIKLFSGPWTSAGKVFEPVVVPQTSADISPSLAKITQFHPSAIMVSLSATQTALLYSQLHSQGFNMSHVISHSGNADFDNFFDKVSDKSALEGTVYSSQFASFDDTSDPEVRVYLHAMQTYAKVHGRGSFYQGGFAPVITDYLIAKTIGFGKFDAATLKQYLLGHTVPIFLGYQYDHATAPASTPGLGASYVRFLQYHDGKLVNVGGGFINAITGAPAASPDESAYAFLPST